MIKVFILLQMLIAPFCLAAPTEQSDRITPEMVRQRQFAGGRDEEDLNVQANTTPVTRKMDAKMLQSQVLKGTSSTAETPSEAPTE